MKNAEPTAEDYVRIEKCRLFDGCEAEEIRAFLHESGVQVQTFSGRETLPQEVRSNCWGIVLTGSVRIYSGAEGEGTMLLNVVGESQPFDIASLAGCRVNPVMSEAKAAGKSRIAFIGTAEPTSLMERHPQIAANVMGFFCGRIAFLNRKIHTLSRGSVEQRLADYLLSEFTTDSGQPEVVIRSCAELAVRLNMSRASLYRALGTLEESGMIARSGKVIGLLDVAALQNV